MEQAFIQNVCPGAPVRKLNCNGIDVSIEAIAKRVGTLGRLLHRHLDLLVVIFDRERRTQTSEELEQLLAQALQAEELTCGVIIGVPDRDIEVWMVADCHVFKECAAIHANVEVSPCEGRKGKSRIKYLRNGRSYIETVDGPTWLKKARPAEIAKNSESFRRLYDALQRIDCWWLQATPLI